MSATAEQGKVTPKILFEALLKKERIGHAYLFEGPSGTGKKETAKTGRTKRQWKSSLKGTDKPF